MASINKVKARKEYVCSKCGKEIHKGDEYLRGTANFVKTVIRCTDCGIKSWELSSSDYTRSVAEVVENWRENYAMSNSIHEEIAGELEYIKEDLQDRYDNIPDNLKGSERASLMEERIDCLEFAIDELYSISDSEIIESVFEEEGIDLDSLKKDITEYDFSDLSDEQQEIFEYKMDEDISSSLENIDY